jgi:hypothetical protein
MAIKLCSVQKGHIFADCEYGLLLSFDLANDTGNVGTKDNVNSISHSCSPHPSLGESLADKTAVGYLEDRSLVN